MTASVRRGPMVRNTISSIIQLLPSHSFSDSMSLCLNSLIPMFLRNNDFIRINCVDTADTILESGKPCANCIMRHILRGQYFTFLLTNKWYVFTFFLTNQRLFETFLWTNNRCKVTLLWGNIQTSRSLRSSWLPPITYNL